MVRWVVRIVIGSAGILLLAVLLLHIPAVQRIIIHRVLSAVTEKTHTRFDVGYVSIAFTHSVVLHDIFIESSERDTLLSIGSLAVDINLLGLLSNSVNVTNIRLDSITANISRASSDSSFNFDFILNAISSEPSTPSAQSPPSSWKFRLGAVQLNGVHGSFVDAVSRTDLSFSIGAFEATMDHLDLEKGQYAVGNVKLTNSSLRVITASASPPDTSSSILPDISVTSVTLNDLHMFYADSITHDRYIVDLGSLNIEADRINLPLHTADIKSIALENTKITIQHRASSPENNAEVVVPIAEPWTLSLGEADLRNNSLQVDVIGAAATAGLDPQHLRFEAINLHAMNLFYGHERISAEITDASCTERSGLALNRLSGIVEIDSTQLHVQDLRIETPRSRLALNGRATYNSFSELQRLAGTVRIDAQIMESHIALSEVLFFQPLLPLNDSTNSALSLTASLTGSISDLQIIKFAASIADSTAIELSGSIKGLPDMQNTYYAVTLHRFHTGNADISALVIDSLIPQSISIPSSISLTGNFAGTTSQFTASTNIVTSLGDIFATAALDTSSSGNRSRSRWKSDVTINALELGTLLKDSVMFGAVSLKGSASGIGLQTDKIKGNVNILVSNATVNGYPYRGMKIRGTGGPTDFAASAEMRDSSIDMSLKGSYTRRKERSSGTLTVTINGSDLRRLNVTTEDIRVSGTLAADLSGTEVTNISGSIVAREIVIMKNGTQYRVDSVIVTSSVDSGKKSIIIVDSPILEAGYEGTIAPADLPAALQRHLKYYFSSPALNVTAPVIPESFKFHIGVRDPSLLTAVLIPDLHRINVGVIEGSYNSEHHDLRMSVSIPAISYAAFSLDSLAFIVSSDEDQLQGALTVRSISDSLFLLSNLRLSGTVRHDSILVFMQSTGDDGSMKMHLAGGVRNEPEGYSIHLDPKGVMFHNTAWSIPADHVLRFGTKGITAERFRLSGNGQALSINSSSDRQQSVTVGFDNFAISTLSRIVARDSGLIRGIINGTVLFNGPKKTMSADLKIGNVTVLQRQLGDISFHLHSQQQGAYAVRLGIAGQGNQLTVNGSYGATHAGEGIDLECIFTSVNLAAFEPFTFGAVRKLSGTLKGTVRISGTLTEPALAGHLSLMNVEFTPAILESHLRLHNAGITFTPAGIEFTEFVFKDIHGNSATLTGELFTTNYQRFRYDLQMKTRKFLLMNSSFRRDALFYGTVVMNSNVTVRGDGERQRVTAQAAVVKGTDFALVLPSSELDVQERKGIVQFAGLPPPLNPIMSGTERRMLPDSMRSKASTLDVTSNISVDQETKLRILIDPVSGDSLVIQGNATFSVTVDPGGKLSMTGRYEIVNGTYQLSFGDFIHREFTIAGGSSLTWLGSPVDADIDITAIYTVKASFLDLIQGQMSGMSNEEKTKYKQKLPIRVFMNMKGKLRSPNIHFTLDLPPAQRGALNGTVYAKLMDLNTQESELNKQVFALLVLGRFVQENPVSSSDGGGISDLARSSASQILSAQLNRLSERYIAGANLAVGLDSYKDYSSGTEAGRTQLQLALSKQLFKERVTVTVGGNVDLEGERSQKNSLNNIAGDLAVQYKLTEDGRWQLQVFRQNAYEGAIDGDITKTGAGVAFTIDFNKLFGITLEPDEEDEE